MSDISPSGKYFLMETREGRKWIGNSAVFWAPRSAGYTCNLDKAGIYSEDEVAEHRRHPDMVMVVPIEAALHVRETHADHTAVREAVLMGFNPKEAK